MRYAAVLLIAAFAAACGGEAEEAERYDVEVMTDGGALERFETDEGYEVELQSVKLRVRSLEFTVGGEAHASTWMRSLYDGLVPTARAHPNHEAGGEVAGELTGPLILHWRPGEVDVADTGRFLEGEYAGYNLDFSGEPAGDDDPLPEGLMARLEGIFDAGAGDRPFVADIEVTDAAEVFGGVLQGRIPDDVDDGVVLKLLTVDDYADTTLFDGVRFSHIETDDGVVVIDADTDPAGHGMVRSWLRAHGYYDGRIK